MAKRLLINLLGFILKKQKTFYEYTHTVSLYNKAIGLALFPFLLSIPFIIKSANGIVVSFALLTIFIIYILRFTRSLKLVLNNKIPVLYTVLYVSAFEIAPMLVIYRVFVNMKSSEIIVQLLALL